MTQRPSPRQVALGLFILFQLAFLIISNLLGYARWTAPNGDERQHKLINRLAPEFADERGQGWVWSGQLDSNLRRWMELTGQDQNWSLFAPNVGKATGFPAVVFIWDDPAPDDASLPTALLTFDPVNGFDLAAEWNPDSRHSLQTTAQLGLLGAGNPWDVVSLHAVNDFRSDVRPRVELVLSENEPEDVKSFVRLHKPRHQRYEDRFYRNTLPLADETRADYSTRMTRTVAGLLQDNQETATAYLRFRLEAWLREHPGEPAPKQVVLMQRTYRIRGPHEPLGWDGPFLVPMGRWRPAAPRVEGQGLVEAYDFVEQRCIRVSR